LASMFEGAIRFIDPHAMANMARNRLNTVIFLSIVNPPGYRGIKSNGHTRT
jgi:hypothetical protein